MEQIKDVLNQVINKLQTNGENEKQQILCAWPQIMPVEQGRHSAITSFKDGNLTVNVNSSNHLYWFNIEKQNIIKTLNKIIGENIVKKIYFRIGRVSS